MIPTRQIALALLVASCAANPPRPAAAPAPTASAPPVSPAADRPSDLGAKIDPLFAVYAKPGVPGCVVAVYHAGAIAYARAYGSADLERDVPLDPTSVFNLESMSKQFTATAIALLVEDGRIAFDDDVRKYVPELPDAGNPIPLRDLLHHTSGLHDYLQYMAMRGSRGDDHLTRGDVLSTLAHVQGLSFPTGTRFQYANTNYVLLALVVERVTGHSFAEFARARIFEPLGMTRTRVVDDYTSLVPARARGYAPRDDSFVNAEKHEDIVGDGNVFSTVGDLARWDANFYDPKVGGPALLDALRTPGRTVDGKSTGYGMGLFVDAIAGVPRERHNGAGGGYRVDLLRFPSERTSVAVLCNRYDAEVEDLSDAVAGVLIPKLATAPTPVAAADAPPAGGAPLTDVTPIVGTYVEPSTFEERTVRVRDRKAWFGVGDSSPETEIVAVQRGNLYMKGFTTTYAFEPGDGRRASRLVRIPANGEQETFERVETPSLDAKALAEYAGRYASDEVPRDLEFVVKGAKLEVRSLGDLEGDALTPVVRDGFRDGNYTFRFTRSARGRIDGVTLSAFDVHGMRWRRVRASRAASE